MERCDLLDPTLSAEEWTEDDSKEVSHVWIFVLCCCLISLWGITPRKGRHLLNEGSGTNVPSYFKLFSGGW